MHPILFKIGPVTLYTYGLMVALGFIAASCLASWTAGKYGMASDKISTLSLIILLSGVAGARLGFVILNLGDFIRAPLEIVMINRGGLVFYGGVIAAIAAGSFYIKAAKMPAWDTLDIVCAYIPLAHSLGRIGCFFNGCCYGALTYDGAARYPTQLIESAYLLVLYMALRSILRYRAFKGQVFWLYIILYAAGRFLLEFIRGDSRVILFNLTVSQIASVILLAGGIAGYAAAAGQNAERDKQPAPSL